jgi:hypothetical protein
MKSNLIGKPEERTYPVLKIIQSPSTDVLVQGTVVLFTREETGMVVHCPAGYYDVGHQSSDWSEDQFDTLRGTIELFN